MIQPTLTATPSDALQPTAIAITGAGFAPGEIVRIASTLVDDAGVTWSAHGHFMADARGEIDLATAPSDNGTYEGVDVGGLLWSMQPPGGISRQFMLDATERAHKLGSPHVDPVKPHVIELSASTDGQLRARTTLTLRRLAEGIEQAPLRDGRLRGHVFRWKERLLADGRPRGCIFTFTGSGGGLEMGYAPVLASLGYDVVCLAYFAYEDLPKFIAAIPLEYFEEGFQWAQRELGAETIAVQGASRGGELAIALASFLPQYIKGVIGIVPMYTTSVGWDPAKGFGGPSFTFRGEPIPHCGAGDDPDWDRVRLIGLADPKGYASTPEYRKTLEQPETRASPLPIERATGPVLLISGVDDKMWPSAWGSDLIINRLRAQGFTHPYRHLCLQETGHITPFPNTVTTFTPAVLHSLLGIFLACGGTPAGTARASRQTWDATAAHYRTVFGH